MSKNDDHELFKKAMEAIKPLKPTDKLAHKKPTKKYWQKKPELDFESSKTIISDYETESVAADTALHFSRSGVQPRYFKKLCKGIFPIEAELDLHGHNIDEGRSLLIQFIEDAQQQGLRVVRIIHGKGYRGENTKPIIKNKVNTWLKQLAEVLAFCSCQPKDGGTGAVYVLLRRNII